MTKLLYGFADEEAEMELGMGGRLSKGCPPKVLWWAGASLFHCCQDFPKQLCNMEITSENHICNSAENIYDPLTRGKKVEMEARSLIEQRRLGIRRAEPGRPVRLTSPPPRGGYLLTLFLRLDWKKGLGWSLDNRFWFAISYVLYVCPPKKSISIVL